ncbi:MAG: hypothetical protein AVDCRST_MAG79-3142, partial [uncultured Thermoleophilia bacterium]
MDRDLIRAGADRGELVKAEAVRPRNLAVAGGVFAVGFLVGAPAVFLLIALLVYAGLIAAGASDRGPAAPARQATERLPGRMDPGTLDPEIGTELTKAQAMERSIAQAIAAADHPLAFEAITEEVAEIVTRMESSAKRAQLIKDALDDQAKAGQDDRSIQAQIEALRPRFNQPEVRELVNDLEAQRRARVNLRESLERFKISMARLNASLTLIRTRLVEMSAAEEETLQGELAQQAREVRERTERFARTMAESTPMGGDDIQRQLDEGAAAQAAQGRTTIPLR